MSEQTARNNLGAGAGIALDFMKYWLSTMKNMSWNHEQAKNLLLKMVEDQKVKMEDANKILEEWMKQANNNQEKLMKVVEEGVNASFAALNLPSQSQIEELSRKIDELAQKLENRQ